jgi:predicted enzyme related to lactoylglutathione lyase
MEDTRHDRAINYIEFNVTDITRSKEFYGSAFGWSFTDYGPSYCEFSDGNMKGGFDSSAPVVRGGPLVILYSSDLSDLQARIETAGGKIVKPVFEFPGGRRFHFTDPDGYELAAWSET